MSATCRKSITDAIETLDETYPFFAAILCKLNVVEDDSLFSAGTNGASLLVNPGFFSRLTESGRKFVLLHESAHVLFKHPLLDIQQWNRLGLNFAADYQANSLIWKAAEEAGDCLERIPGLTLLDRRFDGMRFAEIYQILRRENRFDENSNGLCGVPEKHPEDDNTPPEDVFDGMIADAARVAEERGRFTPAIRAAIEEEHGD